MFNQNPMMPPMRDQEQQHNHPTQHSQHSQQSQQQHQAQPQQSTYLNPPRPPQHHSNIIGPSPDSILTTSTPRSGQNNLDLSEYLDPADKVEPKMPFFVNNPSTSKTHASTSEDDAAASGRQSDGEDPGESCFSILLRAICWADSAVSLLMLSVVEAHALVQL